MAGKQKSVFIRFNMADEADCDLYMKLAEAAGSSVSLTAYAKRVLEEHFSVTMEMSGRQEFYEQILSLVREEMQAQGMKLVGALLAGFLILSVKLFGDYGIRGMVRCSGARVPSQKICCKYGSMCKQSVAYQVFSNEIGR